MPLRNTFVGFIIATMFFSLSYAQPNIANRLRVEDGTGYFFYTSAYEVAGEIVLGGTFYYNEYGDNPVDMFVSVVSSEHNSIFTRKIEIPDEQYCVSVIPISSQQETNLLVSGNNYGDGLSILTLYSLQLNPVWEVSLSDSLDIAGVQINEVKYDDNGGDRGIYLIVESVENDVYVQRLVRISPESGAVIWSRVLEVEAEDDPIFANKIAFGDEGRIFVAGAVDDVGNARYFVIATTSDGEFDWEQIYETDLAGMRPNLWDMTTSPDGGPVLTGHLRLENDQLDESYDSNYFMIANQEGEQLWDFGLRDGNGLEIKSVSPATTQGGGYIACGTRWKDNARQGIIVRVDAMGQSMWELTDEQENSIVQYSQVLQLGSGQFAAFGGQFDQNEDFMNGMALFTDVDPDYKYFTPLGTGSDTHTILVATLNVPNVGIYPQGNYPFGTDVGVFCGDICVGSGVWWGYPIAITASSDEDSTEAIDGFTVDSPITYAIYDRETMSEIPAVTIYAREDTTFQVNGISDVDLEVCRVSQITGNLGWNLVSSNVDLLTTDISDLFFSYRDEIKMLKDPDGHFYVPPVEGFAGFDNIGDWISRNGYQMKSVYANSYRLVGRAIPADRPIELTTGWDLIAYYPDFILPVRSAVASIDEDLVLIKNDLGQFYYIPRNFTNIGNMVPGEGYWIKVARDCDLVYPTAPRQNGSPEGDAIFEAREPVHFTSPTITGRNMSLLIVDGGTQIPESAEVGIFAGTRLVGSAVSNGSGDLGVAIWGDDLNTEEIDGAVEGDQLSFKVWNGAEVLSIGAKVVEGDNGYKTDGLSLIQLTGEITVTPDHFDITAAYPTPFNSRATIEYSLAERSNVTAIVFDQSGRQVAEIKAGEQATGNHTLNWEATNLPSGIYLLQLNAGSEVRKTKLVLLR